MRARRRIRLDLLLVLAVLAAVAAVALVQEGTAASQPQTPGSPRAAASAFSRAYLSYLYGRLPAGALRNATARVRSLVSGAIIPRGSRSGPLTLARLRVQYVSGATSAQAMAEGRDRKHAFDFDLQLGFLGGRWQVTYIVPPDLDTILAVPSKPPPAPPELRAAAGRFAVAYVDYREGDTRVLPPSLTAMREQIQTGQDPLAATTPRHAAGRLESLKLGPVADGAVAASAVVGAGGARFTVEFDLERVAGRWQAWGFPEASR